MKTGMRDSGESRKKYRDGIWATPKCSEQWAISSQAPNRRRFKDYPMREYIASDWQWKRQTPICWVKI